VRAHQTAPSAPSPSTAATPDTAAQPPANADCLTCHDDDSAARANGTPVIVKAAVFAGSIHGALGCTDCHQDLQKASEFPHAEKLARVDCATCHEDAVQKYKVSVHAKARRNGSAFAATCSDCHGTHETRAKSDPASTTHHLELAGTCAKCHGNAEIIAKGGIPTDVTKLFADSIHGTVLARSGLIVAPTCSDCHGAHDILKPKDPESPVAMANVPSTCGKCHEGLARQFKAGVHGALLAAGKTDGPACQTCHSAHSIQRADRAAWQLSVIGQCGTCHAERVATFRDTFHGQVTALGYRSVAGCADCHGAHEILPASDPKSPIAPGNLVATCGKCHENATENFVKYDPHANKHDRTRSPVLYYTSKFMTVLLLGVFGTFGLHTTLWFAKELRVRRERRRGGTDGADA
jgi:nitrate/TMAO reductase-like tetraheme cytochrome c subunit